MDDDEGFADVQQVIDRLWKILDDEPAAVALAALGTVMTEAYEATLNMYPEKRGDIIQGMIEVAGRMLVDVGVSRAEAETALCRLAH